MINSVRTDIRKIMISVSPVSRIWTNKYNNFKNN